jgi:hypothetical protein
MRPHKKCPNCGKDLERLYNRDETTHNYLTWGFYCKDGCGLVFVGDDLETNTVQYRPM